MGCWTGICEKKKKKVDTVTIVLKRNATKIGKKQWRGL